MTVKSTIEQAGETSEKMDNAKIIEKEIEKLQYKIRAKRKELRTQKPIKKRGRKKGSKGAKCKKLRYHVEREHEIKDDPNNVRVEVIGDFCTIDEIAKKLGLSYGQVHRTYKKETKLSETLIITKI